MDGDSWLSWLFVVALLCMAAYFAVAETAVTSVGRIRLRTLWNSGAAFGLPLRGGVLSAVSALVLVLFWFLRKEGPVGAGLILGGGASNLYERLRHRRVLDYVQFPRAPWRLKRYVYNLADFAIFLGGVLLLLRRRDG